jgi:hypothetical protein
MLFVNSGDVQNGIPGNVLLAFSVDGKYGTHFHRTNLVNHEGHEIHEGQSDLVTFVGFLIC